MNPRPTLNSLGTFLLAAVLAWAVSGELRAQVNSTWEGFDNNDLNNAGNWSGLALPSGDHAIASWVNSSNLSLTYGAAFTGQANSSTPFQLSFGGTGSVAINSNAPLLLVPPVTFASFRAEAITVNSGAGAVSFGTSGVNMDWVLGSSTITPLNVNYVNNSSQTVTFGSSMVRMSSGGSENRILNIGGTGNWNIAAAQIIDWPIYNSVPPRQGAISINKTGSGTLALGGVNTYSGAVNISGGTLQANSNTALGFGAQLILGTAINGTTVTGGTTSKLDLNGNLTVNEVVTLSGGSLINSQAATTATLQNGLAGIALTNGGSGYTTQGATVGLTLSGGGGTGASTTAYIGNSTPPAVSTTIANNANGLGAIGVINSITLVNGGSGYTSAPLVDFSGLGGSGATATAVLSALNLVGTSNQIGGAGNLLINAVVSGVGGGFEKVDAGTLTLAGANTYTGGTTITAGTLQIGNGGTTGSITGNITNNAALVFNRSNSDTFSGNVSGNGSLTHNGPATLTLSGDNSGMTGSVVNNSATGFLVLSNSNSGSASAAFNLASAGGFLTFTVAGGTVHLGSLTGVAGTTLRAGGLGDGTKTFSIGALGTNTVFAGNIIDATGTMFTAITKVGAGTLTLSNANTYTGGTAVNAGTLALSGAGRLADTGAVTVSGGTLDLGGISDSVGAVTLNSGAISNGTLTGTSYSATNSGAVSAVLAGSGAFTKTGAGAVTFSAANTYTGNTLVTGGTLVISGTGSIANSATTVSSGASLNVNGIAGVTTVNAGGTLSGAGTLGATSIAGLHTPGNSPGLQSFGTTLDYTNGSSVTWELIANTDTVGGRGTSFDGINVGTNLTITGTSTINLVFNVGSTVVWADTFWDTDREWLFYDVAGTTTGTFALGSISVDSMSQTLGAGRGNFSITYQGSDVYLTYSAIPEPSTTLLLAGALTALVIFRRRRA